MSHENLAVDAVDVKPSGARRLIQVVMAVLVVVVLPVVLMEVLVGHFGANAMFLGLVYGLVGAKLGGTRRMLYLAPGVGVAAGLGALTAYDWWWVLVLAISGFVAGAGMRWGWLPPLLMIPLAATFATPLSLGRHAVAYGFIAGIATLYGVVLARRFKTPEIVEGQRVPPARAVSVAILLGAALAGSAAIGVALGWTEPYWVPEPILILVLYMILGKRERIKEKAVATALGAAAAIPVAILTPPPWAITLIASIAAILAVTEYKKSYTAYYGLYTFALVLALSSAGNVGTEAAHRGSEILIGIGILVVGLAVLDPLASWLARRRPDPVLASPESLAPAVPDEAAGLRE
jgi:hypothetical protein